MKIHLRFGLHRDTQIIRTAIDKIDGLVIPANILAYQSASTSVFINSLQKSYIIDPMTSMLQNPKGNITNDEGELRDSVKKMCAEYRFDLESILSGKSSSYKILPSHIPDINVFCETIYNFQKNAIQNKSKLSKAAKYIKRYGKGVSTTPRMIVSPYFKFNRVRDDWYNLNITCANETLKLSNQDETTVVINCSMDLLNDENIRLLVSDFRQFKNFIIWLDNFDEAIASGENIRTARKLIHAFGEIGNIEALFGGYLIMMMARENLNAVSHGILYSQHKSFDQTPGVGRIPERYYIPKFHAFRSLSQTDLIFHKHPELMCDCEVCNEALNGNPDNIILLADEPDKLRHHFLATRRKEADYIFDFDPEIEASILQDTYIKYNESLNDLPNPDSVISGTNMRGLNYLQNWISGIRSPLQ